MSDPSVIKAIESNVIKAIESNVIIGLVIKIAAIRLPDLSLPWVYKNFEYDYI